MYNVQWTNEENLYELTLTIISYATSETKNFQSTQR